MQRFAQRFAFRKYAEEHFLRLKDCFTDGLILATAQITDD